MQEHYGVEPPADVYIDRLPDTASAYFVPEQNHQNIRQALINSEERFQKLVEQAPEAFFSHDLQGRFLQVNQLTCQLTGYSRREFLSMTVGDLQKGIDPEQAKALWSKVLAGETVLAEDVLQRKDGSTFPAEVKISQFKTANGIEIFGFFRDISDSKQQEAEKEALIAQMQKALNEVKRLSGLLRICANCHKIRDDDGRWRKLETYIQNYADIDFSHSICPDCTKELYPSLFADKKK